jgi:F-box protein, helicase, 18
VNFTEEQMAIINATGNIKINAVAGSGKTTTIIEYAKTRPQGSNILYIAFNKSVKIEASKRFAAIGLNNVTVETAHSLAYKHIVYSHQYKVKNQDYKINEIAEILGLKASGEKHDEYIIANHIIKFIAYFCNSNQQKVQDLNYLDTITDPKAKIFVGRFYTYIEAQTRIFLSKMNSGEIEITHDFYLKKFQLSNPQLYYNYILFDEAQDASAAMLDVFLKQAATKVIVGDTHQQIYGWRYAVNSLEKAHFNTLHLSTSFRFEKNIAHLAVAILDWKEYINDDFTSVKIIGKGNHKTKQSKAVIARTNLGLLLKAIEYVTEKKDLKNIYFEGNINSYTYADEGTSLYDVLNLFLGKKHLIKDSLIKMMKDGTELEEYIEKTEDVQLGMMLEIVKKYEDDIPSIIKKIKEKHIADNDKEKAEIIFSTVHRCKGMEYDVVTLVNDFITQERIESESEKEEVNKAKLNEEINLLYVAVTRAKTELHIPEKLLSKGFVAAIPIKVIKTEVKKEEQQPKKKYQYSKAAYKTNSFTQTQNIRDEMVETNKAYSVEKLRETHNDGAYQPWTHYLDNELKTQFNNNVKVVDIAAHFGRTNSAIYSRLKKLNLVKQ